MPVGTGLRTRVVLGEDLQEHVFLYLPTSNREPPHQAFAIGFGVKVNVKQKLCLMAVFYTYHNITVRRSSVLNHFLCGLHGRNFACAKICMPIGPREKLSSSSFAAACRRQLAKCRWIWIGGSKHSRGSQAVLGRASKPLILLMNGIQAPIACCRCWGLAPLASDVVTACTRCPRSPSCAAEREAMSRDVVLAISRMSEAASSDVGETVVAFHRYAWGKFGPSIPIRVSVTTALQVRITCCGAINSKGRPLPVRSFAA